MRRSRLSSLAVIALFAGAVVLAACTKIGTNTNGTGAATNTAGTNLPANPGLIFGVNPAKGPAAGGTATTLTGEGFSGTPTVFFGTAEGKNVQVKSAKEITVTTPPGSKGKVDITLKNATGPTSSLQEGFTYE